MHATMVRNTCHIPQLRMKHTFTGVELKKKRPSLWWCFVINIAVKRQQYNLYQYIEM